MDHAVGGSGSGLGVVEVGEIAVPALGAQADDGLGRGGRASGTGAVLAGVFGTSFGGNLIGRCLSHTLTILGVFIAFVISATTVQSVALDGARFNATLYEWMVVGGLKMEIGFLIDGLNAMMMCVVTFVSLMVHIYTIGYMEEDEGYNRFFGYISLFTFSMLMLVMSNNFLQLYFGWEAVGLMSYLLIGFWYTRPTAIYANLKAFMANRVGDFGFILGIGLVLAYFGTLDYAPVFARAGSLTATPLDLGGGPVPWEAVSPLRRPSL